MQIRQKISELSIRQLYLIIMLIFIVLFYLLAIITQGKSMYLSINNALDKIFSDFFESAYDSMKTYGESGVIYPPFINLCYRIIGTIITPFAPNAHAAVSTVMGGMCYAVYAIIAVFLLCYVTDHLYTKKDKLILTLVLLLSMPFFYAIERGNIIIIAAMLLYPFIIWHDSEDKKKRYVAYICLALSVNIKLYPVVFCLLILRDKRYREFLHFVLICAAIFFISLLILQDSLLDYFANLTNNTQNFIGIGISNVVYNILYPLGLTNLCGPVSYMIIAIVLILTVYITLKSETIEYWKLVMLLSLILCTCGGFNAAYCLFYLLIPLIMFLETDPKKTTQNWIYLILFILMTAPMIGIQLSSGETGSIYEIVNGVVPTIALFFVIISELLLMRNTKNVVCTTA